MEGFNSILPIVSFRPISQQGAPHTDNHGSASRWPFKSAMYFSVPPNADLSKVKKKKELTIVRVVKEISVRSAKHPRQINHSQTLDGNKLCPH